MNYLNPHTHDLSGDAPEPIPFGKWIGHADCTVTHDPKREGWEVTGLGWRDAPDGFHEHYDQVPATRSDGARVLEQPTADIPPTYTEIIPKFNLDITISDGEGLTVMYVKSYGVGEMISRLVEHVGDSFRDFTER